MQGVDHKEEKDKATEVPKPVRKALPKKPNTARNKTTKTKKARPKRVERVSMINQEDLVIDVEE